MGRVNIVKKVKVDGVWKLLAVPRNAKGNYDWNALPQGLYIVEWYDGGKRRRESAGVTTAQALEAQRRKKRELEGRALGMPGFEKAGEKEKKPPLHVAVAKYLKEIEAPKSRTPTASMRRSSSASASSSGTTARSTASRATTSRSSW